MWNKEITLIKKSIKKTDDIGNPITELVKRKVLATEKSVTNSMLFYGAQFGYKPVFVVQVRWFEYEHESFLECDGIKYVIRRAFKPEAGEFTELQCEELIGDKYEL
nr:MAG TPA: Minor capsid protein [Caudoviricetes sp.]